MPSFDPEWIIQFTLCLLWEQILQNVHGLLYTVFSEPSYGSSVKLILTEMTLALNSLLEVIYINDEKLCSSVVKLVTSLFFLQFL